MKYYQEITLLPDSEVGLYFLWQKVFMQIHLTLVSVKDSDNMVGIGVSFPEYEFGESNSSLGSKLRLFAESEEVLVNAKIAEKLKRFSDYIHITTIRTVPNVKGYASFVRWSGDQNPERLARRRAKRHNESFEEALAYYKKFKAKFTPPFIQMKSLSGGRDFRLYIKKNLVEKPVVGKFSTYGLAVQSEIVSTVPVF
mgnify:CR=1 FL=1